MSHLELSSVKFSMRTDWDVIVVGAGLAGLTAGATAAAGGVDTVVLEAHQAGGRARSVVKGPYVFNMGGHGFYLGGPGAKILRALGVEPHGAPSPLPRYQLVKDGELHVLPSGPGSFMRTTAMGAASKAEFGRLLGLLPAMRPADLAEISVDQWIADHNLGPDAAAVVRALIRFSTYTADSDELSAEAAVHQLQIGSSPGVLYLHGGWAQLINGLSHNVRVETGCKVTALEPDGDRVIVGSDGGALRARRVIVAPGTPSATRGLLPADPGWLKQGRPVTAACLDLGLSAVPDPGYVLSADEPLIGVVQSPPARQAPEGHAVVAVIRYGASNAAADRLSLDRHTARIGVNEGDIRASRFLARMTVAGSTPRASDGGLRGRPRVTDSGQPGVYIAGDWVGPEGLLADASIASGHAAAREALGSLERAPALIA